MNRKKQLFAFCLSVLASITVIFAAPPAEAQINCSGISRWSGTSPQINQPHIFCGEWDSRRNRAKGFHSRPSGVSPNTVASFQISQAANSQGVYGGNWSYAGRGGQTKFSTMFPDRCTQQQVINSISYAASSRRSCPSSAPNWAWCGSSAPSANAAEYCNGDDGSILTVAGAFLNDGRINTAFPLR